MGGTSFDVDLIVGENPRSVSFAEGGVVFVKGDRGEFAYLVKSGCVEIRGSGRAMEAVTTGGLFGEMALIDGGPRSASAVASDATELFVIDKVAFARMLREVPDFGIEVMRLMAQRLRNANARVAPASSPTQRRLARGVA